MVIKITVLIIIVAVVILLATLGTVLFFYTFVRKKNDDCCNLDDKRNSAVQKYRKIIEDGFRFIDSTPHERVYIKSYDGLKLAASYYNNNSDRTILLFHGYRSAARRDFSCVVSLYFNLGYNVLLVDQRSHGESEGKIITFGVKERRDVLSWCEFLLKTYGDDKRLYFDGLSMGSATVLMSLGLKLPDNVKAVIADCGYTTPAEIIKDVAKKRFHISGIITLPLLDIFCRVFAGFSVHGASAPKALETNKIPVLLIHGTADGFVPCEMSKTNYNAATAEKQLVLVEGADHGLSYLVDTDKVETAVIEFLNNH